MGISRRLFLASAAAPAIHTRAAQGGFPQKQPARALFPTPGAGADAGVNPPGFAWWRADGAASYRLIVRDPADRIAYEAPGLADPVHVPSRTFAPGTYTWDVEALDSAGRTIARRGAWKFRIVPGLAELPWEDPRAILARVPEAHPRYIFLHDALPEVRRTLATTRREAWAAVRAAADAALKTPLPPRPDYDTFAGKERQRLGYVAYYREFSKYIDAALAPLSLAYLLSGDERYGLAAKKMLLHIEPWGVEGLMSVLSPYGDEPGLHMARYGARAYDWLYALLDNGERARVRDHMAARARQLLRRLRRSDYLAKPEESHAGRIVAYLSDYAVVLAGEAPDAPEWLDYSLRALMTFYPHWGDADGGWAEGISYATAYNGIYLQSIECLRAAAGVDLYKRPFFRKVPRFFFYCASPVGEMKPFGDGADRGGAGPAAAALMTHWGRRFREPAMLWWAGQAGGIGASNAGDGLLALATPDDVRPAAPVKLPQAAVFHGVGWAALHSAIERPHEDTFFLFKSSPFGSVSHSHADQNAFAILKGGRALAIPSGYYGPAYGSPHHAEWTRATKANNAILVNGEGQVIREAGASGRIAAFRHQNALTYVCGDAAPAYAGKLTRFLRHVLFLRPGVFVVMDELEAPEPARFQWLLHALEQMRVGEGGTVTSTREGASLTVKLAGETGFEFSQTHAFDTPFNARTPQEYQRDVKDHWHFTAATERPAPATRIAAAMIVRHESEKFIAAWKRHKGWHGVALETDDASGEIWAQIAPGAAPPPGIERGAKVAGIWRPRRGAPETLMA